MKKSVIWLIFLTVLAVVIIAVFSNKLTGNIIKDQSNLFESENSISEENPVNEQGKTKDPCFDSDNGKDYYTKGYITRSDGTKEYDKCDTQNPGYEKHVIEFYCIAGGSGQTNYGCPYGCSDGKCNSEPSTILSSTENSPQSCLSGYLEEYRCDGNNIQKKYQYSDCSFMWIYEKFCVYGCENGKCKDCYDSDGGKDYYTKGYIIHNDGTKEYDECSAGAYEDDVWEHYCVSGGFGQLNYKCPYGCSDGRCLEQENKSSSGGGGRAGCGCKNDGICETNECKECPDCLIYIITKVIDGDTVKLSTGESVRLLEINAAESGQQCYQEAKSRLEQLILNKKVMLEKDVEDKDSYGRLLRYIYVDNTFVNLVLVREGLANVWIISPNVKYETQLKQAEEQAKQDASGCLWKKAEEDYSNCFIITNFHYDAYGDDNYNLNNEYVTLKNTCSFSIDMTSWKVSDLANHIYTFSTFDLNSQTSVTLYTGTGTNTASNLYWGRTSGNYAAIWNNGGDTLYLRDDKGNLVLSQSY